MLGYAVMVCKSSGMSSVLFKNQNTSSGVEVVKAALASGGPKSESRWWRQDRDNESYYCDVKFMTYTWVLNMLEYAYACAPSGFFFREHKILLIWSDWCDCYDCSHTGTCTLSDPSPELWHQNVPLKECSFSRKNHITLNYYFLIPVDLAWNDPWSLIAVSSRYYPLRDPLCFW